MFACSTSAVLFILTLSSWLCHQSSWAASNYCTISTCGTQRHTLCLYPNSGPSSLCRNYDPAPLSSDEKAEIVAHHNQLRQRVASGQETRGRPGPQPPASDMKELKWDDELATIAQRWADQCAMIPHDDCRDTERFRVGQNVVDYWSSDNVNPPIENLVAGWYDEVGQFSKNDIDVYRFDEATGHYTQMVWGNTSFIGCGRARDMSGGYHIRLVCDYGPAGNFIGRPVYKTGRPASACTDGVSRTYPGLCS
ncbi:venom allergen 5-like [Neodiprion fabricii]|uniref:venom allergen 5-like n=1 Tax=Neodiprion fabricii TaxID=2872261 RepID=UPI001ED8F192|nr:venom allergen 5-like [Neodiprion fabricii]